MIDQERLLQVKTDMTNDLQETKDLLQNTRNDREKKFIQNEIYKRCLQTDNMMERYIRKIEINKDMINRFDNNINEYINTIKEFEFEINTLETIIRENNN
jgi:hypothetical protein